MTARPQFKTVGQDSVPHPSVGRNSVEPSNERSEASNASIPLWARLAGDARSARASSVGCHGSTESCPTFACGSTESRPTLSR
jgi:hypothetical protein